MKNMFLAVCVLGACVSLFGGEKKTEVSDQLILNVKCHKREDGLRDSMTFGLENMCRNMDGFEIKDLIHLYGVVAYPVNLKKDGDIKQVKCTEHESCFFTQEETEVVSSVYEEKMKFLPKHVFFNKSKLKKDGDELMRIKRCISRLGEPHKCEVILKVCNEQEQNDEDSREYNNNAPEYFQEDESELLDSGVLRTNDNGENVYIGGLMSQIKNLMERKAILDKELEELQTKSNNELALLKNQLEQSQVATNENVEKAATISSLQSQLTNYRIGIGSLLAMIMLYISYTQRHVIQSYIGA